MMKIGIIGAGAMGTGIAQVAATAGHPVTIYDSSPDALKRAAQDLKNILEKLAGKGKIKKTERQAIYNRFQFVRKLDDFRDAGLVIEAIVEKLDVKRSVFKELQEAAPDNCILATNTSSLSVAAIASACEHPERVIGIHFFNPAPLMKLVEIVPAVQTAPEVVEQVTKIIKSWEKTTVLAKDTPGFIVNRVARPFYGEALRILEEGIADAPTIDWAMTEIGGFRMGPFTLMDFIGHDVNYTVTETVFEAFFYDPRYKPSFTQKRLVEAGYLGRKSGRGFYNYAESATPPVPARNEAIGEQIVRRIVVMLINEAADAVFWGIATRKDIDLAMTTGVNYPKGLLQWADQWGIAECVDMLDSLYRNYHEDRYRCSPLLRRMARAGETFY